MQGIMRYLCLPLLAMFLLPMNGHALDQGLLLGYGFAELNNHASGGEVEGGKKYDFFQAAYFLEFPRWERTSFVLEPFAAYVSRPESGIDGGFDLLFRWYPFDRGRSGLFFDVGAGAAYTSIGFQEQGTHLLGILVGGIGWRYKAFFFEDRFRHYSNGHSAYPNRSVNANIICAGMHF